jgi:hypothetical protein
MRTAAAAELARSRPDGYTVTGEAITCIKRASDGFAGRGALVDVTAYPAMSTPFSLAGKRLRNRIVHASISTQFPAGARVTERLVNYHASRARGGAAMIVAEPLGMWRGFDVPARVRAWNDRRQTRKVLQTKDGSVVEFEVEPSCLVGRVRGYTFAIPDRDDLLRMI